MFCLFRLLIKQKEKKEKVKSVEKNTHVVRVAGIKETRIRATRACLVQQLLEAEETEAKHRLRVSNDHA